jgi:hypothetical protein
MKIEKKHKMPRLFVIAALIVAVSGVTVIMTSPTASGLANLAYAAEDEVVLYIKHILHKLAVHCQ